MLNIEAGLSPILYHFTRVASAISILSDNKFFLQKHTARKQKDGSPYYFLSTSRANLGGYHIDYSFKSLSFCRK